MHNTGEIMQLCRLCLVKEQVNVPIFEGQGDVRQIFQKISSCLPVKINRSDKLPKNICDGCSEKLDLFYDFWNTSVNSEKQLLEWLGQTPLSAGAGTTIAAKNSTTKPTDPVQQIKVDVKQEPSDHTDNNESFQAETAMADDDETSFKEESAPPPKRARRAVTKRKPITVAPDSDDDDDDDYEPVEPLTKLEDESGNSDNDNDNDNEDDSFAAPSTSADDQPGPSGLGKDGVEAPYESITLYVEEGYSCIECGRYFDTPSEMENHMRLHNNATGYQCPDCYKVFHTKKSIEHHSQFHKEKKQQCSFCEYRTWRKNDLKRHTITVHNKPFVDGAKRKRDICKNENKTEQQFKCNFCDNIFFAKIDLRSHIIEAHNDGNGEFTCDLCQRTYSSNISLHYHKMRTHDPNSRILCEICSSSFSSISGYNVHKRIHEKRYVALCEQCGIGFITNKLHEKHLIRKHGLMKYICHICGKSLVDNFRLKVHLDTHATKDEIKKTDIKCPQCDKIFASISLMKKHVRNVHVRVRRTYK